MKKKKRVNWRSLNATEFEMSSEKNLSRLNAAIEKFRSGKDLFVRPLKFPESTDR